MHFSGAPLVIQSGCFSWDDQDETLSSINMRVEQGELIAVVGNVGSGKASLRQVESFKISFFLMCRQKFTSVRISWRNEQNIG